MKRTTRLALASLAACAALVAAGSAAAVPRLSVGSPERFALGGSTVLIHFTEERTDAAPAKITMYAPEGYTANGAAVGQRIGTFHANMQTLAASAQSMIATNGDITSEDPAKYSTSTCAASAGGTSPAAHRYVWLLHMTVAGQPLDVPVFVDTPIPTTDSFASNSQVRLTICLASPYAAAGAASDVKLTNLRLTLNPDMMVNPSTRGLYAWRTIVTPYKVNSGAINTAGTVEARAVVFMPKRITLAARVATKRQHVKIHGKLRLRVTNWAVLRGRLLEGIEGVPARVAILSGPNVARLLLRGSVRTRASGAFVARVRLKSRSTFQVRVDLPDRDVTSKYCATSARGIPCVSATAPGFTILSDAVTLRPQSR
jgi:hypothetical protein